MINPSIFDFQIALQAEKGTGADAPSHYLYCLSGSDVKADPEVVTVAIGEASRVSDGISFIAGAPVAGNLVIVAQDDMLPLVQLLCLGDLDTSGTGDPYAHAGTINQTGGVPYFTLFKHVDDLYEKFIDCKVNTFRFETSAEGEGQLLKVTLGIVGIGLPTYEEEWASPATAEDKDKIFLWHYGANSWSVDSTAVAGISEFILEGNNNLATVPGEDKTGYALAEQKGDITCSTRLVVEDLERYLTYMYGSSSPSASTEMTLDSIPTGQFSCKLERVAASPGPERSFAVSIPELTYAVGEPPAITPDPSGAPIYQTLGGLVTGDDPKITITTKNGTDTYELGS